MNMSETRARIAAFFDLDGTLIAEPSVEWRFFENLRERRAIPTRNYWRWLARAVWLMPRGMEMMRHANKMYLCGLCANGNGSAVCGQPSRRGSGQAEMTVPRFFAEGVDQVAWHARQGHAIVLVSGTLAPLAQEMALALTLRLAVRGIAASVAVCATRVEENDGRWTGRIVGDAMFGEAKGRALRHLAKEEGFDLVRCYAYGDSASDRAMLEAVGRPCVVNPEGAMERLARKREWAVLAWTGQGKSASSAQTAQRRDAAVLRPGESA
jgi:HAD superfamily hydrolase (TIGR01490 family)